MIHSSGFWQECETITGTRKTKAGKIRQQKKFQFLQKASQVKMADFLEREFITGMQMNKLGQN